MGFLSGYSCSRPEELLSSYDLVFAKGRSALEALATGTAVITCDAAGLGCMVNTENLESLRELNFGIRTLNKPMDPEMIFNEIQRYDPDDAEEVSRRIRSNADMEHVIEKLLALYQQVIEEYAGNVSNGQAEYKSAGAYLRWLSLRFKEIGEQRNSLIHKEIENQRILDPSNSLIHELRTSLHHREMEIQNFLHSKSWRITRPLRQVRAWAGRIMKKP